ncbi:MAG: metallophosphoesterase [Bacteroidales bacterium]|nr:metallophosphoesterase [Bacteroidales bacterium]
MIQNQICLPAKKVFFTSDTHFFHNSIISHASRPFANADEMNACLIRNWNIVVPKDGIVFHLGDFCFGTAEQWNTILDQLKGKIFLVAGNHDMAMINSPVMKRFENVDCEMEIVVGGQKLILNHFPFLVHGGRNTRTWQLYGHIHTNPVENRIIDSQRMSMLAPSQYDVGVDNNEYSPVSFNRVRDIITWQIENGKRKREF